eukprot:154177_1
MEKLILNVNVPQPAQYAPKIRCSCYDWDRFSGNDLIGRFFISFVDVLDMMHKKTPFWYHLTDQNGNKMKAKVYIGIELIDVKQKNKPIFRIDKTTNQFYLHLLTIGVRHSKGFVHKPQIVYYSSAKGTREISTDPSSNYSANNANFFNVHKMRIKIPINYKLAPAVVVNFRSVIMIELGDRDWDSEYEEGSVRKIQKSIGTGVINLQDFMIPIKDSSNNDWVLKSDSIILQQHKEENNDNNDSKLEDCRFIEDMMKIIKPKQNKTNSTLYQNIALLNKGNTVGSVKGLWILSANNESPFKSNVEQLFKTETVSIRCFIFEATELRLFESDHTEKSILDVYLKLRLGDIEYSTEDYYISDVENGTIVKFYDSFEFTTDKVSSKLFIEIWNYDDDKIDHVFIGKAEIDIDDRWYSKKWRDLLIKPMENCLLRHPLCCETTGNVKCYIDIITSDQAKYEPILKKSKLYKNISRNVITNVIQDNTNNSLFTAGDYSMQCHVIECRSLNVTIDPVIEIKILSKAKYTSIESIDVDVKENDGENGLNVIINETLMFNFDNIGPSQLQRGECIVNIWDSHTNVLIASTKIDIEEVYMSKHHEIYRQWLGCCSNDGKLFGYVCLSLMILGPNDEAYIKPDSDELETESSLLNVMMPPQVETNPHLLKIYIHQLDKLMIMDKLTKSSDPYVEIQFAGYKNKTTIFKRKLDVLIHEMVTIPVMEPILGNKIKIYVKDHDVAGKDDIIGTYIYEYNKIKKQLPDMYIKPHWMHMYGAPSGKQKKGIANKMNTNIIEGTTYRGSMLLSLSVNNKPNDDELKPITTKCNWDKKLSPKITQWVLQVDVYQGVEVGDGKGKFQIKMMIRDLKIKTEFTNCIKGSCEWYEILKLPDSDNNQDTIDLRMPKDIKQCPDVIFYLIEKKTGFDTSDNCISYLRFSWN